MTRPSNVRPYRGPLTELDARELLAKPLLKLCSTHGPTRVGKAIGCHEKTVRNARDEKSTLTIDCVANMLLMDDTALDGLLEYFGRRSVPLHAACDTDDRQTESSVLQAALTLSLALADDNQISAEEIRASRPTIENAIAALQGLLGKLVRAA
ncbi:MAG TPA: hypothetical protein VF637_13075 [Sphingomicrobium sp.]